MIRVYLSILSLRHECPRTVLFEHRRTSLSTIPSDDYAMKKESFIDRHQLWPFYRRRKYCDETMEAVREVWREMEEGYTVDDYPDAVKSFNVPTGSDTKYTLVEKPRYLKGRQRMAERGYDLIDLDLAIGLLRRGYKLPHNFKNHRLKGNMKEYMECHIAFDWVLVYQYNDDELILYAIDTGTHRDVFGI